MFQQGFLFPLMEVLNSSLIICHVSYLVCVDVSGAVASAAVVTSQISQEPPGQTGEIPIIQSDI